MNRGDIIECLEDIGQSFTNKGNSKAGSFTKGREYRVLAGLGDGDISRSDGRIGAFLLNPNQMCVSDDFGNIRLVSCDHRFKIKKRAPTTNKTRVPVTHLFKPTKNLKVTTAVMGEFSHADANP